MPTDLELDRNMSERARAGDPTAWRALYDSTCDSLFAFLCFQVGDRDEARDILQETYLQAFRRLDTYRGEAPLGVWLRRIALGKAMDWKRVALRRLKRTTTLDAAVVAIEADLASVHFESEGDALRCGLAKLSGHQRAALLLREWEGRSFAEIAGLLGCAESTARVHHTRARERMRSELRRDAAWIAEREWEGQGT